MARARAKTRAAPPPANPAYPEGRATAYARDVIAGRTVAGVLVRLACQRHLDDLARQGSAGFPFVFNLEREEHFFEFAELVCLTEGVPFVAEPFQEFIAGSVFGWVHASTGYRRFRTAFIEMGKGNGKTPLAAIVGLYCLVADDEPAPEIYAAAVTRDQANIMFRDAKNIAAASPELDEAGMEVLEHNIDCGDGFFRTVSSEGRSLDGKRPHCSLLDEIHEHQSGEVVQKMRAGMKARRQPIVFEITNSGYDRYSICWEHHELSRQILEGLIEDETWFAYVCTLDICAACRSKGKSQLNGDCEDCDDWHDPAVWVKANPGLGTILPELYLQEQVKEADAILSSRNLIMRLNFCIWTESAVRWMSVDDWNACEDLAIRLEKMRGRTCYPAFDLSSTTDITALGLLFPGEGVPPEDDEEEMYEFIPFFWVPAENVAKRAERDNVPYPQWRDDGYLLTTEGNIVDQEAVRQQLKDVVDVYGITVVEVAHDRWGATKLVTELMDDGFEMVGVGQGYASMSGPSKELERLIVSRRLRHDGNPVMRWMVGNTVIETDAAGNIKPSKSKSTERIDGVPTLVMALGRAMAPREAPDGPSVYEERGVRRL